MDYTKASGVVEDETGRRQFVDRDIPNGVPGTSVIADDLNGIVNTIMDVIKVYGVTADSANDGLLTKAIGAAVAAETQRASTVESNLQSGKAPLAAPSFVNAGGSVPKTTTPNGAEPNQIAN